MVTDAKPLRVGVWPGESGGGNPFTDVFADALRGQGCEIVSVQSPAECPPGAVDVFHMHWPEHVFWTDRGPREVLRRVHAALGGLRRLRRAGKPVVWMVHNLAPHEMAWKRRLIWRYYRARLLPLVDAVMTLSPATIPVVRERLPGLRDKPAAFGWLPLYPTRSARPFTAPPGGGGPPLVYAFLGLLRPYKGVETLIAAFRGLDRPDARLIVAGRPLDRAYGEALEQLTRDDPRVRLDKRHLSDAEFAARLVEADVVVLPFRDYLHSSSIVHAVGDGAPVLTPDTPYARSLRDEIGGDWVQLYEGRLTPAVLAAVRRPASAPPLAAFAPARLGERTVRFYRELLAASARSGAG